MTTSYVKNITAARTGDKCVKVSLDKWEAGTERGFQIDETIAIDTTTAGVWVVAGLYVFCKEGTITCPGVRVRLKIEYFIGASPNGTTTKEFTNAGVTLGLDATGALTSVTPEWTSVQYTEAVPTGSSTAKVTFFIYQDSVLNLEGTLLDSAFAKTKNPVVLQDMYLLIDRELIGFQGLHMEDKGSHFFGLSRAQRGTLRAKHKKKAEGKIVKVIGGTTKDTGHPLNVLLRLLMSRMTGTNTYAPASHTYDAGDGFGLGLAKFGNNINNTRVDVAGIEALRDATPNYRCEFRFTEGIKSMKEWAEAEIMRPFGFRWSPGKNGMVSVTKIDVVFLDQERAGSFGIGGVFTPTDAPGWYASQWVKSPNVYLWVKETNLTYPITAMSTTTVTATGAPTSGNYTCAIVPNAAVQPATNVIGYPYVAVINDRDMEGAPEIGYKDDVINEIVWEFDYDPSNTVDTRRTTRHLTLINYDEQSFWGKAFYEGPTSSYTRYNECNLSYKSAGLRGVGASKFANGYNLNGNRVARMVSYDLLRRWREQIPTLKFTTGMNFMNVDVGDIIRVQHPDVWDLRLGVQGIDKICQVSNLKNDITKKKITVEAIAVGEIQSPPLLPPITFPTLQQYWLDVKHPTAETIKHLKVREYPFFTGNLYFIRQTFGSQNADDAHTRTWHDVHTAYFDVAMNYAKDAEVYLPATGHSYKSRADNNAGNTPPNVTWWIDQGAMTIPPGLCIPNFYGYRHTNIYICTTNNPDPTAWTKIAETNQPYVFFAWEADDDSTTVDSLYMKFSYSSHAYDPITGEFQESSWCPNSPSEQTAIEPFIGSKAGQDMGTRRDESCQVYAAERLAGDRLYFKLKGPMG